MQDIKIKSIEGLDYDDVLVIPRMALSKVDSRSDVDTGVQLTPNFRIEFPVIVSPMREIVDADFAIKVSNLGGLAVLHRMFKTDAEWAVEISKVANSGANLAVAVGVNTLYQFALDHNPKIIVVDVANGYTRNVIEKCREIKNYIISHKLDTLLMAGNVVTSEGVANLASVGVDIVRVGIGGGALCSTRNITGIGCPQITALLECCDAKMEHRNVLIISDGGIRNSGDVVKSIVAGADLTMAGSMFASTYESPAKDFITGMASKEIQEIMYDQIKSVEGIKKAVEKKYSLKELVDNITWGIKSAGTYLGASNLTGIWSNGAFVRTGINSIKNAKEIE